MQAQDCTCQYRSACWRRRSSATAGKWELDSASAEFLEPASKKAEAPDGLEPVYPQKCATQSQSRSTFCLLAHRPAVAKCVLKSYLETIGRALHNRRPTCRSPLKSKSIPKLVAKALSALDTLPGAADMDILPEQIRAERNLTPWCQVWQRQAHISKCLQFTLASGTCSGAAQQACCLEAIPPVYQPCEAFV